MAILTWLKQKADSSKHTKYIHSITAFFIHYFTVFFIIFTIHDKFLLPFLKTNTDSTISDGIFSSYCSSNNINPKFHLVSKILTYYVCVLYPIRLVSTNHSKIDQNAAIYEFTWLCNTTLCMSAIALRTCRPLIASSFCVAVSIDQVLWYVDLAGYMLSGFKKFPVGVAKYITWKSTTWSTKFTCTHHLWTIPLILYACSGFHWASFPLSIAVVVSHVCISRWLTPFVISNQKPVGIAQKKGEEMYDSSIKRKYLNVNLSHELWKDITFSFLQIGYDNPPVITYLFRLLWRWQVLNLIVFLLVLLPISRVTFGSVSF